MGNANNVRAWGTGVVYTAATGSTMPTDIAGSLDSAWADLGLLDQDAGAEWTADENADDYYAWGFGRVRTLYSQFKRSVVVTASETNAVVVELLNPNHGATVNSGVTTFTEKAPTHLKQAFIVEETDGTITRRRCIKSATVSLTSSTTDSETGVALHQLTIDVFPDTNGALWTEITDDPAMADLASA